MKNFLPRTIFEEEHDMFRDTCNLTWLRLVRCSHGTAPNIAHDFY